MPDYRRRVAEAIAFARNSVGMSQQELAAKLGRDKRTLQKWEKGEMKVSIEDFFEVFDTLRLPSGAYLKWIRHPELFPRGMEDIRHFETYQKRAALTDYYASSASPVEIEQEYYVLFGDHGSSYYGMRQERIANLQTPLRDRKRIAGQILEHYQEAVATGTLTDPEAPQPDMEILKACYRACMESVQAGENRYTLGVLPGRQDPKKR